MILARGLHVNISPAAGAIFALLLFDASIVGASAVTLATTLGVARRSRSQEVTLHEWGTFTSVAGVDDYLALGLRLGRLLDGLVDAYYGPPELARRIETESSPEPARLVADARSLLARLVK